jgi:transcriptional regulator with XRE-family HTH domain
MPSETVTEGLNSYGIGRKLRKLRLRKGIGLVELGQHSGLSPAMISKIERGKLFPTLPTLLRLSLVFSVGLDHFFTESEPRPVFEVMRKSERQRFPDRADADPPLYHFESLDFKAVNRSLTTYLAHFQCTDEPPPRDRFHSHEGVEFLYLISGTLKIYSGDDVHEIEAGDSVYFDASSPHSYVRTGTSPCTALVVTVP